MYVFKLLSSSFSALLGICYKNEIVGDDTGK